MSSTRAGGLSFGSEEDMLAEMKRRGWVFAGTRAGGAEQQIIARDMAQGRKDAETRYVLDRLRRTAILYAERPGDAESVDRARVSFTDDSARIIAPLIEAVDILWAIIYASDGCQGHRDCVHSMEPWQRARDLLYRKPQSDMDDRALRSYLTAAMLPPLPAWLAPSPFEPLSPKEAQRRHFDEAFGEKP